MTELEELYKKIIPLSTYQQRNGFSNEYLIDSLSEIDFIKIEEELIKNLEISDDTLIGETLAYMKSKKSLPFLRSKLNNSDTPIYKILWASYIYKINNSENDLIDISFHEFLKIKDKYELGGAFYLLAAFHDKVINDKIATYINDEEFLVAYHARQSLGIDTTELVQREEKNKT